MKTQSPKFWSDIMGAADIGDTVPEVVELTAGTAVLERGTIVSLVGGKAVPTTAGNEATVYGVLLDDSVDTAVTVDGKVTGSVARHGSFKASQLIVGVGTNAATLATALRDIGIYLEGALVVPTA